MTNQEIANKIETKTGLETQFTNDTIYVIIPNSEDVNIEDIHVSYLSDFEFVESENYGQGKRAIFRNEN